MPASWLRYPAKTIRPPTTCPSGRARFRTRDLAVQAPPFMLPVNRGVEYCDRCGGWHRTP